jgi:hypothetical protein
MIQTRIHPSSLLMRGARGVMVRPTRSRLVTDPDIVRALGECNMIKTKSLFAQVLGISGFASCKARDDRLTLKSCTRLRIRQGGAGEGRRRMARISSKGSGTPPTAALSGGIRP